MGWTDNEGIIVNNGYKSFKTRLNLDAKINKFLTVGLNAQCVQRDASAIGADWVPVSYTHLDVYKRQGFIRSFFLLYNYMKALYLL